MTVKEAIESRRAIRKYTDEDVPEQDVRELLRLAGRAPSSANVQPWRVFAIRDENIKAQIQEHAPSNPQISRAKVLFVVYSDMEEALAEIEETVHPGLADQREQRAQGLRNNFKDMDVEARAHWANGQTYIFVGFLLLAAQSLGYATSPMLGFDANGVRKVLDIPAHCKIAALVAMGRPDEEGFPAHRHGVDRFTTWL